MTKQFAAIIETEEHNEMIRGRYAREECIYFKRKSSTDSYWEYWETHRTLKLDFEYFWYVTPEELPDATKCDKS